MLSPKETQYEPAQPDRDAVGLLGVQGGKSSLRFEAYKVAATLEQMLTLGGTMEDSWWDYNHGLVVVQGDVEALRPRKRKRVSQKYLKRAEVLRHRVAVADAVALALRSKKDKTTASVQVGRAWWLYICNATRGCVTERRPLRTVRKSSSHRRRRRVKARLQAP